MERISACTIVIGVYGETLNEQAERHGIGPAHPDEPCAAIPALTVGTVLTDDLREWLITEAAPDPVLA